ncbi:MAG: ABC transporter permease [Desulfobacterales bacterium]|nr:MAG: ABC transporter permease [Desulfobacterales bacterium]
MRGQEGNNRAWPLRLMASVGRWTIDRWKSLIFLISAAVAVLWQGCRPTSWRRTVRREFFHHCHQMGTRALPFVVVSGVLVGVGLVFQALYWLNMFGQSDIIGKFLVLVLVREIAPVAVGLIAIVRSVSVMIVELGSMQAEGQIRMLDAQGVDPFIYIVLPRVLALALSVFFLTVFFLIVAFGAGFMAGNLLLDRNRTLFEFANRILADMGPIEFAMIPIKTLAIGYMAALIACLTGLEVTGSATDVSVVLPRGMVKAVIATLVVSVLITLIL